jgi:hypothetical protein
LKKYIGQRREVYMSLFWNRRPGIVNVRMVITEEKILSNIDKIQKLINPNSKKQIVQLDDDAYFKDLIDSVKTYLIEYPKKKNFPASVYKAAYGLVEYATNQFEENTKRIEELIIQREKNIELSVKIKELLEIVENKEKDWKNSLKEASSYLQEDVIETLEVIGRCKGKTSQNYNDAVKLINARISNLETNLHIEIDMERIEDRSKALSFIGIEIADALKGIPTPVEEEVQEVVNEPTVEQQYIADTTFEVKPSLWQRIKQSKIVRTMSYLFKVRIKLELPDALPEGRG